MEGRRLVFDSDGPVRLCLGMSEDSKICDECGSSFRAEAAKMAGLCAECAHWLYGYPACAHEFAEGRCVACGWDGSVSDYVRGMKEG